jgi:elongator complex protein 1
VTTTLYPETALRHPANEKATVANKINTVCDAIIRHFKKDVMELNVQNIITAYVCKVPPDIEAAIGLIASLKG